MISVEEAHASLLALITPSAAVETVALKDAGGRVLARDVTATHFQPPFATATMDGYAIRKEDAVQGKALTVTGEAAAGHAYTGDWHTGEALRISTGAPIPEGAHQVIMQENVTRAGDQITLTEAISANINIRPLGTDFQPDDRVHAPRRLSPADLSLIAAMNVGEVTVTKKPRVAILSTGDELIMPGETLAASQIVASNVFGVAALCEAAGGTADILPPARDTRESLMERFEAAKDADLIVTIGGASVGDHDLVGTVAQELGLARSFYKVAMRPGKPLMAGKLNDAYMIGLPGNPVSCLITAKLFVTAAIDRILGLEGSLPARATAMLSADLPANGPRTHFMRAELTADGIKAFESQDSALLSVLSTANALIIRAPNAPAAAKGTSVDYLPF